MSRTATKSSTRKTPDELVWSCRALGIDPKEVRPDSAATPEARALRRLAVWAAFMEAARLGCGAKEFSRRIGFASWQTFCSWMAGLPRPGRTHYLMDNPDVKALLRIVGKYAGAENGREASPLTREQKARLVALICG